MTALASSLLAALPGGFAPFAGVGAAVSTGVDGAFEGLLAGLLTAETDARPRPPGLPDEAQADAGQTAPDALLLSDSAFTVFAAAPAPLPLLTPVAPEAAEAGATVTPESVDAASNAVAALAAQGWTRPHLPVAAAVTAIAPADMPIPAPAVADRAQVDTTGLPAATSPAVPDTAMPARPDRPVRSGLLWQTDWQPAAARPADDQPVSVRPAAAQLAAPAIPSQPASATPAQPAVPVVPPTRTEAAVIDVVPLAAPVKAIAPDGESRRPAIASRGERPAHAAARFGPTPTAASDRLAPVEAAAEELAALDGDESQAVDLGAAPVDLIEAPEARPPALSAEARAAAVGTAGAVAPETLVRGSPETVAKLAADIVRKLDGQTTRFDLELDPHGLGKVDVAIEIDRAGKMTAALTFDSAQSAADLRGRSGELRLALEQAGFDVSESGLTFDLAGQGPGFGGREAAQQERGWNGRAFQSAQSGAEEADAALAATTQLPSRTRSGVDIRI
ncbi:MAG: flagellar hook-length control protein FliK [Caulobacter sp.]|nr:flagellar hook-length control protein FliK [Caulobacter sp.]